MPKSVRRVVTGHDVDGRSHFPHRRPDPARVSNAPKAAPPCSSVGDARHRKPTIAAPPTPSRADIGCRRRRMAPCSASSNIRRIASGLPRSPTKSALPDDGSGRAAATDRNHPRHAGFHKTATIDYAIVLSGEIYAMMDEGEVLFEGRRCAHPARHQSRLEQSHS